MEINLQLEWGEARKCVRTSGSQSKASGWASPPSRATMICASRAREAGASCAVRGASEVKRPNGALISVQIRLVLRTRCMPLPLAPDHLLRYEPQTLAEHRDLPITIWTVPMARSAVPAGLAFRATFARSTGCSQAPVYTWPTRLV